MTKTEEIMELVEYYRLSGVFSDRCKVRSELKELVADAARYQHIKSNIQVGAVQTMLPLYKVHHWHGYEDAKDYHDLDAAIDKAMSLNPL